MKKHTSIATYLSLFVLALSLVSCQEEFEEVEFNNGATTITANSFAATLITNTATRDGSFDNIVDGASCFDIKFPYTVSVNGLELTINSLEDLQLIEQIFDAIDDDENLLEIIFPITITKADYTEVTLNNLTDLRALAQECKEGGDDDDIECIDFVYPITFFTFNINLEQTGNVVIESDKDLRVFFNGLEDTDLVSIDFPISLKLYDGTTLQVNSNEELVRTIEAAKDACDEDDDDDYNDDDFDEDDFYEELVECVWFVKEFKRNNVDQTEQYVDYIFNFKDDGTVVSGFRGASTIEGTWTATLGDDGARLNIEFASGEDFNLEWSVYDIGDDRIKLFNGEGNRIIMKQICEDDEESVTAETLRQVLMECSWIIKELEIQDDELKRLFGYELNFMPNNVITLSNGVNSLEGTWEVKFNDKQKLVMVIEIGQEPGLNFEWPLREIYNNKLEFGNDDIGYELDLQRVCDNNSTDDGITEIRNVMLDGEWVVGSYIDQGVNRAEMFSGYSLGFNTANQIALMEGGYVFGAGLWRILRDNDEQLKVYLNFGEDTLFDELTEDWDVVYISDTRIELKEIEDDESVTTLVFEKG